MGVTAEDRWPATWNIVHNRPMGITAEGGHFTMCRLNLVHLLCCYDTNNVSQRPTHIHAELWAHVGNHHITAQIQLLYLQPMKLRTSYAPAAYCVSLVNPRTMHMPAYMHACMGSGRLQNPFRVPSYIYVYNAGSKLIILYPIM